MRRVGIIGAGRVGKVQRESITSHLKGAKETAMRVRIAF